MTGRFSPEAFGFGCFLLGVGAVLLLANLGLIEALPTLRKIWPGFLVLWGVAEVLSARREDATGGERR